MIWVSPLKAEGTFLDLLFHVHGNSPVSVIGGFITPVGDVNSDGFDDITVSNANPLQTMLFYGGDAADTIPDAILPYGSVFDPADYDGDGINDIAVYGIDSTLEVFKGYGDSLGSQPVFTLNINHRQVFANGGFAAHLDGDPFADYLLHSWEASPDSNRAFLFKSVFLNQKPDWTYVEPLDQHELGGIGFIDFNCDSVQDIYLGMIGMNSSGRPGRVLIFYGPNYETTPSLVLSPPASLDTFNVEKFSKLCVNLGDIDGDGWDDLEVQYQQFPLIYRSEPGGDTTYDYSITPLSRYMAGVGDINGDGDNDFISGSLGVSRFGSVHVYLGGRVFDQEADAFVLTSDLPAFVQDLIGYRVAPAGDFNGDGCNDIMFSSQNFAGGDQGDVWIMSGARDFKTDVPYQFDPALPESFELNQNYPNPFNPETTIEFSLKIRSDVELVIYDVLGRRVKRLVHQTLSAGSYTLHWDGTNEAGQPVASGVYFYQLKKGELAQSKKMLLLK